MGGLLLVRTTCAPRCLLVCQDPRVVNREPRCTFFAFVARAEEYKKWEPAQMALGLALLLLIGLLPTLERTGRPAASVELNSLLSARLQQETANLKFKHLVGGPQRDSGGASERALMAVCHGARTTRS